MSVSRVSDNMLAVIASLQGGMHSRRKPKYLNENALVSELYPLKINENANLHPALNAVTKVKKSELDSSNLSPLFVGKVRSSKIDFIPDINTIPLAVNIGGFELGVTRQELVFKDQYAKDDITYEVGVTAFNIDSYTINRITTTPTKETIPYAVGVIFNLTKG